MMEKIESPVQQSESTSSCNLLDLLSAERSWSAGLKGVAGSAERLPVAGDGDSKDAPKSTPSKRSTPSVDELKSHMTMQLYAAKFDALDAKAAPIDALKSFGDAMVEGNFKGMSAAIKDCKTREEFLGLASAVRRVASRATPELIAPASTFTFRATTDCFEIKIPGGISAGIAVSANYIFDRDGSIRCTYEPDTAKAEKMLKSALSKALTEQMQFANADKSTLLKDAPGIVKEAIIANASSSDLDGNFKHLERIFQRANELGCETDLFKKVNDELAKAKTPYILACKYGYLPAITVPSQKLWANDRSLELIDKDDSKVLWQHPFTVFGSHANVLKNAFPKEKP
jgi:hypothetical protein